MHAFAIAVLLAQSNPTLGNPAPDTGSSGPPIVVNDCSLIYDSKGLTGKVRGVTIQFTNESAKTADLVTFTLASDTESHTIRDVGSFSPGAEITHKFRTDRGQLIWSPLISNPKLHCSVQATHFTDGTVWEAGHSGAAALPPVTELPGTGLGVILQNEATGVYVKLVGPGSAAAIAGVKQGDRIVSLGDNTVTTAQEVVELLKMTPANTTIPITLERNGTTLTVNATYAHPLTDATSAPAGGPRRLKWRSYGIDEEGPPILWLLSAEIISGA